MKKEELIQRFLEETKELESRLRAFEEGSIDRKTLKGISGGFGTYAQRENGYMLRLRLPGGRVTKETLDFIRDRARKYQIDFFKLTSCQTIQAHNLTSEQTTALIRDCLRFGIITRGGGGDYPRNVMASPLSGLSREETFDVFPYVEAVSDYLINTIPRLSMPRKFKTAFSNTAEDVAHAAFRDLGFTAQKDGTFAVYCAGGLGPNPRLGVLVEEHARPEEVIFYVSAMLRLFIKYGNYQNRAKARTRYLQETLGASGLRQAFSFFLEEAKRKEKSLLLEAPPETKKTGSPILSRNLSGMIPLKQPGLFALPFYPIGGRIAGEDLEKIYQAIKNTEKAELRISPDGGIYLAKLTAREAAAASKILDFGAKTLFETSASCIGVPICQQGLGRSQELLQACICRIRREGLKDGVLPKISISGCPSSCAAHQSVPLGFAGCVKKTGGGPRPAFRLFTGGDSRLFAARLGTEKAVLSASVIPDFLAALGRKIQDSGQTFASWYPEHEEELTALARAYEKRE